MLDLSRIENLAITGANGFVGRSIVEYIATLPTVCLPKKMTLVTRNGTNYSIEQKLFERTEFHSQDLSQPWNLPEKLTHLINLAADGTKEPYSDEACSQFATISENLVKWIRQSNSKVAVFHASSGACFGYRPIDANSRHNNPKETFIRNRIKVEEFLTENAKHLNFSLGIGRLFTFSGRNILDKRQYALSTFILSAIKNRKISINGNPQTQRSYLHQDSMSEWILKAMTTFEPYPILQIGSNEPVTIKQLAEFIAQETNSEIDYSREPTIGDIYIPDNTETRNKLGVEEGKGWKDAVLEMIAEARLLNHATE
jgi:nucleoside-diphosphate-sugar epimerase